LNAGNAEPGDPTRISQASGAAGRPLVRLGILLSGRGSNFLAIAESIRAGRLKGVEIAVVISNVAEAAGIEKARELGLRRQRSFCRRDAGARSMTPR